MQLFSQPPVKTRKHITITTMKLEFQIEDYELVDILKGDASFSALLKEKVLGMDDLSGLKSSLLESVHKEVTRNLSTSIMDNLKPQISDIAKGHMYEAVAEIIKEREVHTQQTIERKLNEFIRGFDPEKIMIQAAKELLKEATQRG